MAEVRMGPNANIEMRQQDDGLMQLWLDPDIDHPQVAQGHQFLAISTPEQAVWIGQSLAAHHGIKFNQ